MTLADRCRDAVGELAEELLELTLSLSRLPDLAGREQPVAEAVAAWLTERGLEPRIQPLGPTSANVVVRLSGSRADTAPSLAFSAHLDTEGGRPSGDARVRRTLRGAWREGDLLVGKGLVNDRAQLAAQLVAMATVQELGGTGGDLWLAAVAQETGRPAEGVVGPSGRRMARGPHVGEGSGARELLASGFRADAVLVGEPTGFAIATAQAGVLQLRVDVPGFIAYTPFVRRTGPVSANPFERAGAVIGELERWCRAYADANRRRVGKATLEATAQIVDVHGGGPLYTDAGDWCHIFVDVRLLPETGPARVLASLRRTLGELGFPVGIVVVDHRRGHVARGARRLERIVAGAHQDVFGEPPSPPAPAQISMWQDTNAFNEASLPAISYGIRPVPEPYTREGFRAVRIGDLMDLARVYAQTALQFCGSAAPESDGSARPARHRAPADASVDARRDGFGVSGDGLRAAARVGRAGSVAQLPYGRRSE